MVSKFNSTIEDLTKVELFERISEICETVNTVFNANELLEISLKGIMDLYGASRGSIFILRSNGHDLELKTSQGMAQAETKSMVKRMGEGIVGRVAESKQPVFVDDIAKDDRFLNFKPRKSYVTSSFICAPLMVKDNLIGVINITDKESGKRFTKDDMQLLDFLTSQIALNFRRIQLYQKFRLIVKESKDLKDKLGQTNQEKNILKNQIVIHEKLASIGKLAGGIAHEFNNPLDGVLRYTNLCLEHTKEDDVVQGYLMEIKHGLNRMANIVKNLLACSRNDTPPQQKVNVAHALDHALNSRNMDVAHKNITINKNLSNDIPLILDLGVERILTNIIHNAIDAVGEDGEISIEITNKKDDLEMRISDNGVGISKENINKIFEPFFTTKDMDKGCGLGLTIVGEIVKSYNGTINIESAENKGTAFIISLPIYGDPDE